MCCTTDPKCARQPKLRGHGYYARLQVAVIILARIDDVESRRPAEHGAGKQQWRKFDVSANRDPGADWRETKCGPEVVMTEPGESLEQRVSDEKQQHGCCENQ